MLKFNFKETTSFHSLSKYLRNVLLFIEQSKAVFILKFSRNAFIRCGLRLKTIQTEKTTKQVAIIGNRK